ncbi:MAG: hypothetical protein NVSMB45_15040 [Ginsengibacter sp.]
MLQQQFDFTHTRENNPESQSILNDNREHFSSQCKLILHVLKSGERLTTRSALLKYDIGDLRRRLKDLRDNGVIIQYRLIEGKFKEWFI